MDISVGKYPNAKDYLALFDLYPEVEFWLTKSGRSGDPYLLLFRQVMSLLTQSSQLNLDMPRSFRDAAMRYAEEDWVTRRHFSEPNNRHILLSDLKDWLLYCMRRKSA
ncbi:hypothetical protein [Magnetofaba australis]|uniref:Uncharacterized protein n=1 Tax=Magnetofaba australis IT-1 TaxID=1434232 RepID=A0A1Y2K7G2_9PROT|nr:hypothetical protein [Magnetofaba australis]OSM06234.1 hypothetical protein MAIT1_01218 [Magnetofaba australis IT-1]